MKFTITAGLLATVIFGGLASGAPMPNAELLATDAAAPPTAVQPIMKLTPEQSNLLKNANPQDIVAQPGNVQRIHKVGSTPVGQSEQQSYTSQQNV